MDFLTRKTIYFLFLISVGFFLSLEFYQVTNICTSGSGEYDFVCGNTLASVKALSMASAILLAPVFLTHLLPNTFENWKKFAVWAVPLTIILTHFISNMNEGGGIGVVGFHPGIVYLPILYGAFFLASIAIIVISAIRHR